MITNKFKERQPKETINIISTFFEKRGYTIEILNIDKSESGTYFCSLSLKYKDIIVLQSNGKGTTLEYCAASGYAELYERFCNMCETISSPCFINKYKELNIKKNEFFFDKNENMFTRDSFNWKPIKNYLHKVLIGNDSIAMEYLNRITHSHLIEVPYQNLYNTNDIIYLDPRLIRRVEGSNGMAAGNTLEEALNQGISELYERYVKHNFFLEEFSEYHAINLEDIKDQKINLIIENIKSLNYNLYVLDLSYNYELPVLVAILIDKDTYKIRTNFGSFPVFEIALERILTELYQGVYSYKDNYSENQTPYKNTNPMFMLHQYGRDVAHLSYINENIFSKISFGEYNKKYFLNTLKNNKDVYNYHCNLCKEKNIKIYFRDCSLDENMCAVQIIADEISSSYSHYERFKDINKITKIASINNFFNTYDFVENLLNTKEFDLEKYKKIEAFMDTYAYDYDYLASLFWNDYFKPIDFCFKGDCLFLNDMYNKILQSGDFISQNYYGTCFYKPFKKYQLLINYIDSNQYTKEEIINFFSSVFEWTPTDEDYDNYNNDEYLRQKIYIEPLFEFLEGETFEKIVESFIPNI